MNYDPFDLRAQTLKRPKVLVSRLGRDATMVVRVGTRFMIVCGHWAEAKLAKTDASGCD